MNLTGLALKNLTRHKTRSALSISTLVMACIIGLFLLSFVTGMRQDMKENILSYYTGSMQIRNAEYTEYEYLSPLHLYVHDQQLVREKLMQIEGVKRTVARISSGGRIYIDENKTDDIPGEKYNAVGMGISFPEERKILDIESLLIEGKVPEMSSRQVVLGYGVAQKTGLAVGDHFAFLSPTAARGVNAMSFEVSGIANLPIGGLDSSYFFLPFDTMQRFLRMEDGALEILIMTDVPDEPEPQLAQVNEMLASDPALSNLEVKIWKEHGEMYSYMRLAILVYNGIALFLLLLGATVIVNTTMMAIFERYREIGILGAMGMEPKEIVRLFFTEALFAGIFSAVIGLILGSALMLSLEKTGMDFGAAFGSVDIEISSVIYPDLKAFHLILMGFYTIGIAAAVTLIPCRKAAHIEPVDAINST